MRTSPLASEFVPLDDVIISFAARMLDHVMIHVCRSSIL